MVSLHDVALLTVGTWLFIYRLGLRTGLRPYAEALTTCCCGLSLALLAPLLAWPPPGYKVPLLAILGVLLSFCAPVFTALVTAVPLGVGIGALLWQVGLCQAVPQLHGLVLGLAALLIVAVFVCTPGVAGPNSLRFVLAPLLSALLLSAGAADLAPSVGALGPRALLGASCAASEGELQGALASLGAWLLVSACAVLFQLFLAWLVNRQQARQAAAGQGDLVTSLLPGAQKGEGEGMKRPDDMNTDRFQVLCKAIFAPEGTDQSHLTENEQKIVEICRKDEFERDRLLWGGGLI